MQRPMIKFWGVRGSIARPGIRNALFGGNTPCVEILYGKERLILDAGTGIYPLGQALTLSSSKGGRLTSTILFSHYHWDHILGLPFFTPIYDRSNSFTIIGRKGLKKALHKLLSSPTFPVKLTDLKARLQFKEVQNKCFTIGRIKAEAFDVNHPNGASGYAFTFPDGKKVVHVTDSGPMKDPSRLIDAAMGADLLIHDAQFSAKEYLVRRRFGHGTYNYVFDIAIKAQVKMVALFHHEPSRDDDKMKKFEGEALCLAKKIGLKAKVFAAREGMVIKI